MLYVSRNIFVINMDPLYLNDDIQIFACYWKKKRDPLIYLYRKVRFDWAHQVISRVHLVHLNIKEGPVAIDHDMAFYKFNGQVQAKAWTALFLVLFGCLTLTLISSHGNIQMTIFSIDCSRLPFYPSSFTHIAWRILPSTKPCRWWPDRELWWPSSSSGGRACSRQRQDSYKKAVHSEKLRQ